MKSAPLPKNLVVKLKNLAMWPLPPSLLCLLNGEAEREAVKAREKYVDGLTRDRLAAFVAAAPLLAAADARTAADASSAMGQGGHDADAS